MGLPGSGKTYLSQKLYPLLEAAWYNADRVRSLANDWDFSEKGRIRQANRMRVLADFEKQNGRYVVCDFVCPTIETRKAFSPDILVWLDTIKKGRYKDTNDIFEPPKSFDFKITDWNDENHIRIANEILSDV